MKVLVTGSDGVIARELIKTLGEHTLLLVDKKSDKDLNSHIVGEEIRGFKPEIVYHLAASFERTDESPFFLDINWLDNISASARLNKVISEIDSVKQYVFASSYLIYDPMMYTSLRVTPPYELSEFSPINPRNLCGSSKLHIENEINFLQRNIKKDMKVAHARIFRVYGNGSQDFVARCVQWAKYDMPVDIWNKENSFDYVHARDVASALKHLADKELSGVFNVGSGDSRSINEVIALTGVKVKKVENKDLFENSQADIIKIKSTGWKPLISLEEGVNELKETVS